MQRYLDQDLDEMEYNQMLGHMQQCSDCTELFQRLVALSHELEQLPKVTPAYSLVDAIMPKLQRIDMGMSVDDVLLTGHAAAAPIVPDTTLAEDNKSNVEELVGWRRRMRGLVSTRIVGGVVAAGLVLGFFVFEQQQQSGSMKNADGLLSTTGTAQQDSAKQSKSVNVDKKSALPESKPDSAESSAKISATPAGKELTKADEPAKAAKNEEVAPTKQQTPVSAQDKSNNAQQGNQSPTMVVPDDAAKSKAGEPVEAPVDSGNTQQEAVSSQPQENQIKAIDQISKFAQPLGAVPEAKKSAEQDKTPAAAASDAQSSMAQDTTPKISATVPQGPALKPAPEQPKAGITGGNLDSNVTGLTDNMGTFGIRAAIPQALPSPDGVYSASINSERHVVITDQQGKAVFTTNRSVAEKDVVTLVKWESGSMLAYQISNDSGATIYVINVTEKTDVKK
ncbi:hypothetical protein [Paenibacillus foliorum]